MTLAITTIYNVFLFLFLYTYIYIYIYIYIYSNERISDEKIFRLLLCGTRRRRFRCDFSFSRVRAARAIFAASWKTRRVVRARPPRIRTLVSLKSLDREKRLLHGFWHLRAHPPRRAARQPRALSFLLPPPLAMFKLNKVSTVSFPLAIEYIEIPSSTEKVFLSTGKEERSRNLSVSPTALQSR